MKALFRYHPLLQNDGIVFDGSTERRLNYTLEGGDVHAIREDLVLIGFSARSSPAAIAYVASQLFAHTNVTDIIIGVMPTDDTAIHLDMIFTRLGRERDVISFDGGELGRGGGGPRCMTCPVERDEV